MRTPPVPAGGVFYSLGRSTKKRAAFAALCAEGGGFTPPLGLREEKRRLRTGSIKRSCASITSKMAINSHLVFQAATSQHLVQRYPRGKRWHSRSTTRRSRRAVSGCVSCSTPKGCH